MKKAAKQSKPEKNKVVAVKKVAATKKEVNTASEKIMKKYSRAIKKLASR